ncbi:hypothetical protein [Haladaptatus sp.]|uniref:hypothetical protein n=1 Tax=Haladaptatus sp. TaxID=1973141 RepID=UPI003C5D6981
MPSEDEADTLFVVTDDERQRGVAVPPTGSGLFHEYESMVGDTANEVPELADELADALVEEFELVGSATPEVDVENDTINIRVSGSRYGPVDRFDHPVASFIAVGAVNATGRPVTLETTRDQEKPRSGIVQIKLLS